MRPALPHLVALALGGGAALLVSCGSGAGLIPVDRASRLDNHLQSVANAVAARDCGTAIAAGGQVASDVAALPLSVDLRLRLRLASGTKRLNAQIPHDCTAAKPHKRKPTTTSTQPTTPTVDTTTIPTSTDTTTIPTISVPTIPDTTPPPPTSTNGGVTSP